MKCLSPTVFPIVVTGLLLASILHCR